MESKPVWLRISIFANQELWHEILKLIIQFIRSFEYEYHIHAYQLRFNYIGGKNIRLAIACQEEYQERASAHFDQFFCPYFSHLQSVGPEVYLPISGLFLPFPSNVIRYGLFKYTEKSDQLTKVSCTISVIMAEALSSSEVNDESILTFGFYLHLAIFHAALKLGAPGEQEQILQLYGQTDKNKTDSARMSVTIIEDKFKSCERLLEEIALEVRSEFKESQRPEWIIVWIELCESQFGEKTSNIESLLSVYQMMTYAIASALGISGNIKVILNYFVKKTIENLLTKKSMIFIYP